MPDEACDRQNAALNCQVFPGVLDRPENKQAIINSACLIPNFHDILGPCTGLAGQLSINANLSTSTHTHVTYTISAWFNSSANLSYTSLTLSGSSLEPASYPPSA